ERSAEALAHAILAGLSPDRREEAALAARAFAARRSWQEVARPLVSWCGRARIDGNRLPFPDASEPRLWQRLTRRVLSR
ncbi:MAG TPA: hypothetical protein VFW81_00505, partial [Thermoanaerobaculia bacterium]|nr:hypothetical protein [Thermoanaerobaculia bacterium]